MGFRIENYTRDELGKIALPGRAVSTLFWVLPIGKWPPGELDRWWKHFTQSAGDCNELGLLLVRDQQAGRNGDPAQRANLRQSLTNADGGNLLDLIPEARSHWHPEQGSTEDTKSILVLSGAFPQPGWGVLVTISPAIDSPQRVEGLIHKVISQSCDTGKLEAIRKAARAYKDRETAEADFPRIPVQSAETDDLRKAMNSASVLLSGITSLAAGDLESPVTRTRQMMERTLEPGQCPADEFWKDLYARISLMRELTHALGQQEKSLASLWENYWVQAEDDRESHLKTLHQKHASWIKKFRYLRQSWPDLEVENLESFLVSTFREDLRQRLEPTISNLAKITESRLASQLGAYEVASERFRTEKAERIKRLQDAEAAYRAALKDATVAQWDSGPAFLMGLEKSCSERGISARSIAWDPARMVGWKLHVTLPKLQPRHLVTAANSVLGTRITETGISAPGNEFSGSLFADYAYFVSMSAPRLNPWLATRNLLVKLLSVSQLEELLGTPPSADLFPDQLDEEIADMILRRWGWNPPKSDLTRPLAGCVDAFDAANPILLTPLNETRISFEGFLKDLCRVTIASLSWPEQEMEKLLSVHCPSYTWQTRGGWASESAKLSGGGALILLEKLVPLAFPGTLDPLVAEALWNKCNDLMAGLNSGSHHDSKRLPPTEAQLKCYAGNIKGIIKSVGEAVGEMPWHLTPTQSFGSDPVIVTGHAWSHSHVEERIIRVLLWAGDERAKELLVWNKSLRNPVMTDAILL